MNLKVVSFYFSGCSDLNIGGNFANFILSSVPINNNKAYK